MERFFRFTGKELGCGLAPLHVYLDDWLSVLSWLPAPEEEEYVGLFYFTKRGVEKFVESNDFWRFHNSVPGGLKCEIMELDLDSHLIEFLDGYQVVINKDDAFDSFDEDKYPLDPERVV